MITQESSLKKTPLYDRHLQLNARMAGFAGWLMPVYYSGIVGEHLAVRRGCGLFDVSHLGELRVHGKGSFAFLQSRLTNDLACLSDGGIQYHLLCTEKGFTIDDVLVYRASADDYTLIVNAANGDRDLEALRRYAPDRLTLDDHSELSAAVAVQGPDSEALLERLFGFRLKALGYYHFKEEAVDGSRVWVSRSGYTGEDGFEIFAAPAQIGNVWDRLKASGVMPCGLGARDTLRLEAGNGLYGNELDDTTTPLEAGLGWAVSFTKGGFVGQDALIRQKEAGPRRRLAAFRMTGRAIARKGHPVFREDRRIGAVTSGSFGPSVGAGIGLAYLDKGFETVGNGIEIEVHGHREAASIVKRPFVEVKHK